MHVNNLLFTYFVSYSILTEGDFINSSSFMKVVNEGVHSVVYTVLHRQNMSILSMWHLGSTSLCVLPRRNKFAFVCAAGSM